MNNQSFDADVVIAGGGMVGGLLAAALTTAGNGLPTGEPLRVVVIDSHRPAPFEPGSNPDYDLRVSALSVASRRMLQAVDAWQGIANRRVCPYRDLSVWDGEANGRTDFNARDAGVAELGYIVENRVIQLSLWDRLEAIANVEFLCPATLENVMQIDGGVRVTLSSSSVKTLTARLVVGADGARSVVRENAGIAIDSSAYDQHALVANVSTELPQQQITWQRFVPTGPQAMLPLRGSRASIVWYQSKDEVARLNALDDATFINELCTSFPAELGGIEAVQARASFPIAKAHARTYIAPRVALAGDAAHTVHPLAGQGVNLGLLDAAALAEVLRQAHQQSRDIGAPQVLKKYERWRRFDNTLMIQALDGLHHAFKPQPIWFQHLRSAGLNTVNAFAPLRNRLMQHAMGTEGDLPSLAKPRA